MTVSQDSSHLAENLPFQRKLAAIPRTQKLNHPHDAYQNMLKSENEPNDKEVLFVGFKNNGIAGLISGIGMSLMFWVGIALVC